MTARLFGTDGIRGPITSSKLAPENMCKLGRVLGALARDSGKNSIIIGRDTRASGLYLESALSAGIMASGIDCRILGILPSAAVAHATRRCQSAFGVVISASHNPSSDNGIKLFASDGFKIEEAMENLIEDRFHNFDEKQAYIALTPGQCIDEKGAQEAYLTMLSSSIHQIQKKLRIVIDCAHGAASGIVPALFSLPDFTLKIIGAHPDGFNINQGCGSEHPQTLKNTVLDWKADVGIAFDGDADRVIFVDEKGEILDGDAVLAVFAKYLKQQGLLQKNTLVSTVMSSVALDRALRPYDIKVERTDVGDKFVARHMVNNNLSLGGENSGHLIMLPNTYTGDGIYFALQFINIISILNKPVSEITHFYQPTPTLLKNIDIIEKIPLTQLPNTEIAIHNANKALENVGRVMLRYSGTENKLRILVEAPSDHQCHLIADRIAAEYHQEVSIKLRSEKPL